MKDDFKNNGYSFNLNEAMKIITVSNKMDMTYEFYIKQNMHMIEWKLNSIVNKNRKLINKFNETWRHRLNRKFRKNRV